MTGRKARVSRDHLVAGVPRIAVLNRVGFDVPAVQVAVPVRVHSPE